MTRLATPNGFGPNPGAKVNIIFVHGFSSGEAGTQTASPWPTDLFDQAGNSARVYEFKYEPKLDEFYPQPGQTGDCTIDKHSKDLLQGLDDMDKPGDLPTIFVAHDMGGLVCANALSYEDAYPAVVSKIRGFIFFETPFHGTKATQWAKVPTDLLGFAKENSNELINRSQKLIDVYQTISKFLYDRGKRVKTGYFWKTNEYSLSHEDVCKQVLDAKYGEIATLLREWTDELGKSPSKHEYRQGTSISATAGDTHYYKEIKDNHGVITGGVATTAENGIQLSGTTYHYYNDTHPRKQDNPSNLLVHPNPPQVYR